MQETNINDKSVIEWQKLTIANRDERIEQLESAIRELLVMHDKYTLNDDNFEGREIVNGQLETLRNLMENKS